MEEAQLFQKEASLNVQKMFFQVEASMEEAHEYAFLRVIAFPLRNQKCRSCFHRKKTSFLGLSKC